MKRSRILIVDDEIGPREALRMVLKDEFLISVATNGKEALDQLCSYPVDLILMDMKMPLMDGMQALRLLKEAYPQIPVLMITAYGTIDTAVEAMKIGAVDFITKPFDSFVIQDKIRAVLSEKPQAIESVKIQRQIQEASEKLIEHQSQLQKHIVQLSKLSTIGMLTQGLMHNLSSPLLVILGRAEMMKEKLIDLKSQLASLSSSGEMGKNLDASSILREHDQNIQDCETIIKNVMRLNDIINNVLRKSRQDQIETPQMVNLSELVRENLDLLDADLFFKHQISKRYDLSDNMPTVKGVYSDFTQTFLNIVENSIDAMRESEKKDLFIKTYNDDRFVYLLVQDTGCGIPASDVDRIFEPFFTTKRSSNDSLTSGTGIGLYMVKLLMEPYRVSINVSSKPGETIFLLKIPRTDVQDSGEVTNGSRSTSKISPNKDPERSPS